MRNLLLNLLLSLNTENSKYCPKLNQNFNVKQLNNYKINLKSLYFENIYVPKNTII